MATQSSDRDGASALLSPVALLCDLPEHRLVRGQVGSIVEALGDTTSQRRSGRGLRNRSLPARCAARAYGGGKLPSCNEKCVHHASEHRPPCTRSKQPSQGRDFRQQIGAKQTIAENQNIGCNSLMTVCEASAFLRSATALAPATSRRQRRMARVVGRGRRPAVCTHLRSGASAAGAKLFSLEYQVVARHLAQQSWGRGSAPRCVHALRRRSRRGRVNDPALQRPGQIAGARKSRRKPLKSLETRPEIGPAALRRARSRRPALTPTVRAGRVCEIVLWLLSWGR